MMIIMMPIKKIKKAILLIRCIARILKFEDLLALLLLKIYFTASVKLKKLNFVFFFSFIIFLRIVCYKFCYANCLKSTGITLDTPCSCMVIP